MREKGEDVQAKRIAHWMVAWTLRALNRTDEALAIQLRLEREREAAGAPSAYVFEELELVYRAKGDRERADHYAELARRRRQCAAGAREHCPDVQTRHSQRWRIGGRDGHRSLDPVAGHHYPGGDGIGDRTDCAVTEVRRALIAAAMIAALLTVTVGWFYVG